MSQRRLEKLCEIFENVCCMINARKLTEPAVPSSETQGQIVGTRKSQNGRKNIWHKERLCFSGTNQKPERRRPFGTGLVRHCPQGLFSPFFTFLRAIYFSARFDFSSSPLSAPGSPRMRQFQRDEKITIFISLSVICLSFTILNTFENKKGVTKILAYSSVIDINQIG